MKTADDILKELMEAVDSGKHQFDANFYIQKATELNIKLGDEQDKLFNLQQKVAQLKLMWFEGQEKKNVSETRLRVEATEEYKEMRRQEAKCKRIEEFIRISKKQVDVSQGF